MHRSGRSLLVAPLAAAALLAGCASTPPAAPTVSPAAAIDAQDAPLAQARAAAMRARTAPPGGRADDAWVACALHAHRAAGAPAPAERAAAIALARQCGERVVSTLGRIELSPDASARVRVGSTWLDLDLRGLSPHLRPPMTLALARDVPMAVFDGDRRARDGYGVPLALRSPRCAGAPVCALLPPEGVFRWATAWIEPGEASGPSAPRLVIADAVRLDAIDIDGARIPLAWDTSAFYAHGVARSPLRRLGVLGLLGGREVGRRAGVYLLDDYDPAKQPLVMIHGLGSNPLIWARLSNAVWGDAALRARYQVWHVVFETHNPLLVSRLRVKSYLDDAWRVLDPEADDPARRRTVVVGHSMGGVVARLLAVDAGDALWDAAFTVPPAQLDVEAADRAAVDAIFRFQAYPGIERLVFIAAPHRGSPTADGWFGRVARVLIGRRTPEIRALERIAVARPDLVQPSVRDSYRRRRLNSVATLSVSQPVRRASEGLLPAAGVPYHTIAGDRAGSRPPGDGVVPLDSALLPGAQSTRVLDAGHDVHADPRAIEEVLRILRLPSPVGASANVPSPP